MCIPAQHPASAPRTVGGCIELLGIRRLPYVVEAVVKAVYPPIVAAPPHEELRAVKLLRTLGSGLRARHRVRAHAAGVCHRQDPSASNRRSLVGLTPTTGWTRQAAPARCVSRGSRAGQTGATRAFQQPTTHHRHRQPKARSMHQRCADPTRSVPARAITVNRSGDRSYPQGKHPHGFG